MRALLPDISSFFNGEAAVQVSPHLQAVIQPKAQADSLGEKEAYILSLDETQLTAETAG